MPTLGPYTFSIRVNGRSLVEHDVPTDEEPELSEKKQVVYIEAVESAAFEIQCDLHGRISFPTGYLGVHLYLDNQPITWRSIQKSTYNRYREQTFSFKEVLYPENQTWFKRDFRFSNLTTTDTVPKATDLKDIARHVGTIRVVVYNMTAPKTKPLGGTFQLAKKAGIPEKALKGQPIDMATDFGEAKPTTRRTRSTGQRFVGDHLLEFVFKYRSRKALQMLDIVPTIPEPVALDEIDPNTLSLAEAREILSRIQKEGKGSNTVKREGQAIKREQGLRIPSNFPRFEDRKRKAASTTGDDAASDDDDLILVEVKKIKSTPGSYVEVLDLS